MQKATKIVIKLLNKLKGGEEKKKRAKNNWRMKYFQRTLSAHTHKMRFNLKSFLIKKCISAFHRMRIHVNIVVALS